VTTSSQHHAGAQPPESPSTVPAPVRAAAGVIRAAMKRGASAPEDLAQAEYDTGILFDPQTAEDIAASAAEQAHAEDQAELDERDQELKERGRQLAAMAGVKRQLYAVLRLLEGRPGTDHLSVAEIAAAAEYGTTPYDAFPMTLTWDRDRGVGLPDGGSRQGRAIVRCSTAYGGRADVVLTGAERLHLASLLDADVRDIHAPCPYSKACGSPVDELDASDPALSTWALVEVPGTGDDARWYCSPMCVSNALARAGAELAAADQAAAAGGEW
jgi:hypothetical protein